jgi:hypothetical protein
MLRTSFRHTRRSVRLAPLAALLVAAAAPMALARAQGADADVDTSAVCLGFAFGKWSPPLDWLAARHQGALDSSWVGHAPGGRGWASDPTTTDSTLMLYPGWWPVGVSVALPTRAPARGDTVTGTAIALVADGRVENPTARVRAWRVPCGAAAHSAPPPPVEASQPATHPATHSRPKRP